jgi:hypothetical protein
MPDPPKLQSNDRSHFARAYLSKLDISTELASPELYSQCMSLLSMEQGANADEDIVMLVNLKARDSICHAWPCMCMRTLFCL